MIVSIDGILHIEIRPQTIFFKYMFLMSILVRLCKELNIPYGVKKIIPVKKNLLLKIKGAMGIK